MSFYKGNKTIKDWNAKVVEAYIDGNRLYKDKYNSVKKEPLTLGVTKYNRLFIERINDLITDYKCLMSIELTFIKVIENYSPNNYGLVMNIEHILTAQKGTVNYMRCLSSALKKYSLKHQNIYDGIQKELNSITERCSRNAKFLDVFAEDCGLKEVISIIQKNYGKNMFNFIKDINAEFYQNHNISDFESIDAYGDARNEYCHNAFLNAVHKSGIDLKSAIEKASEEKTKEMDMMKEKTRQDKYARSQSKKTQQSDIAIEIHNRNIYKSLYEGNVNKTLPAVVYNSIIHNLLQFNGNGCYITIVKSKRLLFMNKEIEPCISIMNAKWFPDESCDDIKRDLNELHNKYPDAIITIQSLSIPFDNNRDKPKQTIEESIKSYINDVKNAVKFKECNNVVSLKFERHLRLNDNVIWFVTATKKECSYYVHRIIAENDIRNIIENNSPKYYMSSNLQSPALFYKHEDAINCILEIKDGEKFKQYDLQPCKLKFDSKYEIYDESNDTLIEFMNQFTSYLNDRYSIEYDKKLDSGIFSTKASKKSFENVIHAHKTVRIPIKIHAIDGNNIDFIRIRSKRNETVSYDEYKTAMLKGEFYSSYYADYLVYMYDKEFEKEFTKLLCEKFDKRCIIKIVELSMNDNNTFSYRIFDADSK